MAAYFTHDIFIHIIFFQLLMLVVIGHNLFLLARARKHAPPTRFPSVSVLVPARNEEKNIERCVSSLLKQDYTHYEVLVLDDCSTDDTLVILKHMASVDPRLKVIAGEALPVGFSGKNWACTQLARLAKGELIYFTDADTIQQPQTLREIVTALLGEQADMLTGFPRQEMHSLGERLLVPFFTWAANSFFPLGLAYRLRSKVLSIAVGQMMLFKHEAYLAIGGHEKLGEDFIDDLQLTRKIKTAGYRWRLTHISDMISCRMYPNGRKAFQGLSNNFFPAFGQRILPFLFVFIWICTVFLLPIAILMVWLLGGAPIAEPTHLVISIALSLLVWTVPFLANDIPLTLGLLYPLHVVMITGVALRSLWLTITKRLTWKGRSLSRKKIKWL